MALTLTTTLTPMAALAATKSAQSPVLTPVVRALAAKVLQRLSVARTSARSDGHGAEPASASYHNPLNSPLPTQRAAAAAAVTMSLQSAVSASPGGGGATSSTPGAPRPTQSGPRPLSDDSCRTVVRGDDASPRHAWSSEFDVDPGATPPPHLSPRSRECTAELALAPATASTAGSASNAHDSHGRQLSAGSELGPWSTESSSSRSTGPPAYIHLPAPPLSLTPADVDGAEPLPSAPRGPAPHNQFFPSARTSSAQTMESVRLSFGSFEGAAPGADWRELPAVTSVATHSKPETIVPTACRPLPASMHRMLHTSYRFRVQQGDRVLVIETRYRSMHRLAKQLNALLYTASSESELQLPPLPPKLRGSARLSAQVVSTRQAAFQAFIEAAIAAVVQPGAAHGAHMNKKSKKKSKKENTPDLDAASARLQRFLTRSAVGTDAATPRSSLTDSDDMDSDDNDDESDDSAAEYGSESRPVPAEQPGGGALCGGGSDRRHRRPRLTTAATTLASHIVRPMWPVQAPKPEPEPEPEPEVESDDDECL